MYILIIDETRGVVAMAINKSMIHVHQNSTVLFNLLTQLADVLQNSADAPTMQPAHIDAWVQTAPAPMPEPDVAIFLHGPQRGAPEVKLVWRADLHANATNDEWKQIVTLCPPTSVEALAAPLHLMRAWLVDKQAQDDDLADIEGALQTNERAINGSASALPVLLWRGPDESVVANSPKDIRPNDTVVIPMRYGGWQTFGHVLEDAIDIAEPARWQAKREATLRLHPDVLPCLNEGEVKRERGLLRFLVPCLSRGLGGGRGWKKDRSVGHGFGIKIALGQPRDRLLHRAVLGRADGQHRNSANDDRLFHSVSPLSSR